MQLIISNKLHLFSLTYLKFILIQMVGFTYVLHVSACTQAVFRHVSILVLFGTVMFIIYKRIFQLGPKL